MEAIREAEGLPDDGDWLAGEGSAELTALERLYEARSLQLVADVYRQHGEPELADLYERSERSEADADAYLAALKAIAAEGKGDRATTGAPGLLH